MAGESDDLARAVDQHGQMVGEYVHVERQVADLLPRRAPRVAWRRFAGAVGVLFSCAFLVAQVPPVSVTGQAQVGDVAAEAGLQAGGGGIGVFAGMGFVGRSRFLPPPSPPSAPVVAFPGAQGFGAAPTTGGRGGTVYQVTNLNDSGAGSLRAALTASGPRTVVFRTGGVINLASSINVFNGDLTIAGQTAPGGGIAIRGWHITLIGSNIIVRGMRFRTTDDNEAAGANAVDGIRIGSYLGGGDRYVVDHCSFAWAPDENIDTYYTPQNITVSYNITSEALMDNPLSFGGRMGGGYGMLIGESVARISVHHNLFASNNERNPILKGDTDSELINNVVYNFRNYGTHATDPEGAGPQVSNVINNYYKRGPSDGGNGAVQNLSSGSLYVNGNTGATNSGASPVAQQSGMTTTTAAQAFTDVLAGAGATAPARDSVDTRIINEASSGTSSLGTSGSVVGSQTEVGGVPSYAAGTAPTDTDADGMPDSWETSHGTSPTNAADRNDPGPTGYTRLEEYINSFFPA